MRIAVDGGNYNPENGVKSGIQRLIDSFLWQIQKIKDPNISINYYYFGDEVKQKTQRNISVMRLPEKFFANIHLPVHILKDRNDVFLGFSGFLPPALYFAPITKIVFIHDLGFFMFPHLYPTSEKLIQDTKRSVQHADKIIVFSNCVKDEIVTQFRMNKKKVVRIYAGVDHLISHVLINRLINTKITLMNSNYFLYVGVIKPIKNIEKLLIIFKAFLKRAKRKDYKLVLIGVHEPNYFLSLTYNPVYIELKDNLIFLENVSDPLLRQYYLNATAILNTSNEEGFCYPVFEALSLGKPVIVDDLPIYREYRRYFQGLSIGVSNDKIVQRMLKVAKKPPKYEMRKIPKLFTWQNFYQTLLQELS